MVATDQKSAVVNEIVVQDWNDLLHRLYEDAWNPELGRYRSRNAFRGLSDASYRLETTLMRLGGKYWELERHLLRNFRKYACRDVVESDSVWHWLSVAKHHGLPTRLLDWTYSPLVAMHFATACIEKFDVDGAIWMLNYVHTHEILPKRLRLDLEEEGANVFTEQMIARSVTSLTELSNMANEDFVLFMEPSSINERIVNQFAFFSICSNPRLAMDDWLRERPAIWKKLIVPARLKWEIRDKLDQANITERVLFPGMDGLSQWLKRHYSPKINDMEES